MKDSTNNDNSTAENFFDQDPVKLFPASPNKRLLDPINFLTVGFGLLTFIISLAIILSITFPLVIFMIVSSALAFTTIGIGLFIAIKNSNNNLEQELTSKIQSDATPDLSSVQKFLKDGKETHPKLFNRLEYTDLFTPKIILAAIDKNNSSLLTFLCKTKSQMNFPCIKYALDTNKLTMLKILVDHLSKRERHKLSKTLYSQQIIDILNNTNNITNSKQPAGSKLVENIQPTQQHFSGPLPNNSSTVDTNTQNIPSANSLDKSMFLLHGPVDPDNTPSTSSNFPSPPILGAKSGKEKGQNNSR